MTNAEVCAKAPTTEEWIETRLGIRQRRIAAPDEQASDMGTHAARSAVASAGIALDQVDVILCALGIADVPAPATAAYIQHKLGMTHHPLAMDVRAACAGGLGGIHLARGMVESGLARHVLVVGSQLGSRTAVDWTHRVTAPLFGDGAGAVVVGGTTQEDKGILAGRMYTDGSQTEIVGHYGGGTREPNPADPLRRFIQMDGKAVWDAAVVALPATVREALADAGMSTADVDFVVGHQANRRLLLHILSLLEVPPERTFTNVEVYGNTAAASALIALDEAVRGGHLRPGMRTVLMAIGAGLTWGALVMKW